MPRSSILAVLFSASFACYMSANASEPMRAGVAVVDITPPVPFRMSGYFTERLSTGIKDPLHAKAIVFQQGDVSAALVFCDLIGIPSEISSASRQLASRATGIPVEHIAISATHSHTGPMYFGAMHDFLHERSMARHGSDPTEPDKYRDELTRNIAAAIAQAKAALRPVDLRSGDAREVRLSFNRRFHMKDGTVRFNPGRLNPNIVRPAGPIEPRVGIVLVTTSGEETPTSAIISFALHLDTVGGTEYSADYPKHIEDSLRLTINPQFTLLFGAGTCGDINHIDVTTDERRSAEQIGKLFGETVATAIADVNALPNLTPSLAVRSTTVNAALRHFPPDEVIKARKNLELVGTRQLDFLDQVQAYSIIDRQRWPDETVPLEVQAFRLGSDTAIVTLPAEVFVELGLAIKEASPFATTLVVELTNNSLGYIPTRKAFAEGSYETVNSRIQPGVGEQLVNAAVKLLKELK